MNKPTKDKYLMKISELADNSLLFWKEGMVGFTTDIDKAHLFEKEEAESIEKLSLGDSVAIPWRMAHQIAIHHVPSEYYNQALLQEKSKGGTSD